MDVAERKRWRGERGQFVRNEKERVSGGIERLTSACPTEVPIPNSVLADLFSLP